MEITKAIEANNFAQVQEIISSGVDVNRIENNSICLPIQLAVDLGHADIVRALLEAFD